MRDAKKTITLTRNRNKKISKYVISKAFCQRKFKTSVQSEIQDSDVALLYVPISLFEINNRFDHSDMYSKGRYFKKATCIL